MASFVSEACLYTGWTDSTVPRQTASILSTIRRRWAIRWVKSILLASFEIQRKNHHASVPRMMTQHETERNNSMNIDWFKCRLQQVDIGESATWFLLFFVYAYGLTTDELGIEWPRAFPLINLSQASLILCLWCLGVSIVVLVEPWLPSGLQRCTTKFRHSTVGLCLRRASVLLAFVFWCGARTRLP